MYTLCALSGPQLTAPWPAQGTPSQMQVKAYLRYEEQELRHLRLRYQRLNSCRLEAHAGRQVVPIPAPQWRSLAYQTLVTAEVGK